jgi:hypothetical protein
VNSERYLNAPKSRNMHPIDAPKVNDFVERPGRVHVALYFCSLPERGDQGNATTDTAAFSSPSVTPATGGAGDARRRLVHGEGTSSNSPSSRHGSERLLSSLGGRSHPRSNLGHRPILLGHFRGPRGAYSWAAGICSHWA